MLEVAHDTNQVHKQMKKFKIEFITSTETIRTMEVEFVTKRVATTQASLMADVLTRERSEQVTYNITELPYTNEDGNLREPNKQERKKFTKGGRTQISMTFRLDADLLEFLSVLKNKGRFINNLLHSQKARWERGEWEESTEYLNHTSREDI